MTNTLLCVILNNNLFLTTVGWTLQDTGLFKFVSSDDLCMEV